MKQRAVVVAALLLSAVAPLVVPAAGAEEVLRATLDNGLRIAVVRNALAPVVSVQMNYLVGSNESPPGFPGMAHALEHMMFRGSPGLTGAQLSYISAALGGQSDAATEQTATQYVFTVTAEDLEIALKIEAVRMQGILGAEAAWRQERGAIEQEVAQDLSNPQYVLYTKLLAALFAGTPYDHDALGTRASFQRTTGPMLRAFHQAWYAPNNAILVIVGDVQLEPTRELVQRVFGAIPARALPPRPAVNLRPVRPRTFRLDSDLPHGLAVMAFRFPGLGDPDHAAAAVLADVLNSQRGVLQERVAAGTWLSAGFEFDPLPGAALGFAAVAFPQGRPAAPVLRELRATLEAVAARGVDPDLVAAARRRAVTRAALARTSIPGLAALWSRALAVQGLPSPDAELAAVQQVSGADASGVARRYLDPARAITAILTPRPAGRAVTGTRFGGKESFTVPHAAEVQLPAWAASAVGRLAIPASSVNPTVTVLPNGLRLIVQPESVSDTVLVVGTVRVRPSLQEPPGQEGVDDVLDALFAFGTSSLDRVAFRAALDEIGANASAGTDFSAEALADHFDRAVELLADNQLRPALPEAAFRIVKRQVAARVAGRIQSAEYRAQRALESALYPPGDPVLREPTAASVSALTREDVIAYYRRVFRPDVTTIAVIGRVDPEVARAVVDKHFGAWTAEGPAPSADLPPVPPNGPALINVPNPARVQDNVTLAQTLGVTRFDDDYYPLELGNHVLGGAFYATRLYRDLRERAGLVYYVDSTLEATRTRALYAVTYACDPANVSRARAIVIEELRSMQTRPVSADELRQAKALLLRRIPLSEASMERIALGLVWRAREGLPLDEPIRAAARYVALTADDVKAAFDRWIRLGDFAQVTEGRSPR